MVGMKRETTRHRPDQTTDTPCMSQHKPKSRWYWNNGENDDYHNNGDYPTVMAIIGEQVPCSVPSMD